MTNHVRSVFLIRHGRTSYNAAHKLQGQVDIPLDAVGEWQVKQTAAALKRLYVDRRQEINHRFIVCSDLKRAHATAQAFADVLGGIEPVDDRRVRERSFGDWDGHAVAELAERYPEDFRSWMESRGGELKYGAEPKEAVGKRGVEALEDWSTRAGDDTDLFVFSHGAWIAQTLTIPMALCAGVCWTTITVRPSPTPTSGNANADRVTAPLLSQQVQCIRKTVQAVIE